MKRKIIFTDEQKAEIFALKKEGKSDRDIAEQFDVSRATIQRVIERIAKGLEKPNSEKLTKLMDDYRTDKNLKSLARKMALDEQRFSVQGETIATWPAICFALKTFEDMTKKYSDRFDELVSLFEELNSKLSNDTKIKNKAELFQIMEKIHRELSDSHKIDDSIRKSGKELREWLKFAHDVGFAANEKWEVFNSLVAVFNGINNVVIEDEDYYELRRIALETDPGCEKYFIENEIIKPEMVEERNVVNACKEEVNATSYF